MDTIRILDDGACDGILIRSGRRRGVPVLSLAALLLGATVSAPVSGRQWTITRSVSVREIYTDNINLDPPGQASGDFLTEITPRVSIRKNGSGGRVDGNLDFSLQTFALGGGSDTNTTNQQLQGDFTVEVVKHLFFVDARATIDQQSISNTGRVSSNNFSSTGNRTTTIATSISPFVRHHLGTYADTELRYTADSVIDTGVSGANSTSNQVQAIVTSGRRFARVPWRATFSRQVIDNDGRSTTRFQRLEGQLSYQINRRFSVFQILGVDMNDFATTQSNQDGFRWQAGGTWTPSSRTSVNVGIGRQFSGSNNSVTVQHRRRRTVFSVSFSENTATTRQLQLQRVLVPILDAFGQPITAPSTGSPILAPTNLASLTDEVFVNKRFDASVALQGRRTQATFRAFSSQRDFQVRDDSETVFGGSVQVNRQLSRQTSASLTGTWQHSSFLGTDRTDQRWDVALSFTRRVTQDISATADFRHTQQDSDSTADEFRENEVTLRVNVNF